MKNFYLVRSNPSLLTSSTLFLWFGKFFIISCRFLDNSHASSPSASIVRISANAWVSFKDCYFESGQVNGDSVQINAKASSAVMFMGHNTFNIRKLKSSQLLLNHGTHIAIAQVHNSATVTISDSFIVRCPAGYRLHKENITLKALKDKVIFISLYLFCKQCPGQTYSVERGAIYNCSIAQIECYNCPRGGQCEEGKVRAKPKFWGYEIQKQVSFLSCSSGYCCSTDECTPYNSFYSSRTGQLCGRWPKGMSKPLFSSKCIESETCNDYTFWLGFSLLLLSFLFFLYLNEITTFLQNGSSWATFLRPQSHHHLETHNDYLSFAPDGRNVPTGTGLLKIIFYYYQVVHILKRCGDWSDKHTLLGNLQDLFTKVLNFITADISFFDSDCPLQNITPVKKVVLLHSMGFCLLGISPLTCVVLKVRNFIDKQKATSIHIINASEIHPSSTDPPRRRSKIFQTFTIRILCAFVHISLLIYSSSVQLVFTLLRCVPFGHQQILFIDGTVQCYQSFQYFLMPYAVVSTLPFFLVPVLGSYALTAGLISIFQFCLGYLFPLPFGCFWLYLLLKQNRSQDGDNADLVLQEGEMVIKSDDVISRKTVTDTLSGPFRRHDNFLCFCSSRLPWEGVLIFGRLLLVIAFTFIYDSRHRMVVILTICVIILASHLLVKPFESVTENFLETLSFSILTIFCGFTLVKAIYYGEDYSSFSTSSQLIHKFNLTEDILILAPVTIVTLVTVLQILIRFIRLMSFCVTFVFRKLSDALNHAACLSP